MKNPRNRPVWALVLGWACLGQLLTACSLPLLRPPEPSPLDSSRQLVAVSTKDWDATTGTLQRYQRDTSSGQWQPTGAALPVVVGRNGLGWGIGLGAAWAPGNAPLKREGDGKAPAGAFAFNGAFGYASPDAVPQVRLPYTQAVGVYRCVDDIASRHYNRLLFEDRVNKDWTSSEEMLRPDDLYRLGLVVEHNWGHRTQGGRGSCIFLHIWKGPDSTTAGCTAMDPADMESLLGWLDPALGPVLVQLPRPEYDRLQGAWGLP